MILSHILDFVNFFHVISFIDMNPHSWDGYLEKAVKPA